MTSISRPIATQSLVSHLLRSDAALSEAEIADIEEILGRIARQTHDPKSQIAELDQKLLESQRHFDAHQVIFSPVRRVPTEILKEIFSDCITDAGDGHPHSRQAPLNLSHVCRRWRDLVLLSPELWSTIVVKPPFFPQITLLTLLLNRSRPLPLSLSLQAPRRNQQPHLQVVWDTLHAELHRWKNLRLFLYAEPSSFLDRDAPLLESVTFTPLLPAQIQWVASLCSRAPRLSRVTLTGNDIDLPWKQLTHFTLHVMIDLLRFHEIMSNAISLVEASLSIWPSPLQTFEEVVLPHLRKLKLMIDGIIGNLDKIFSFLVLPTLRIFNIRQVYFGPFDLPWPHTGVLSLLSRSSCSISELALLDVHPSEVELIELLQSPHLHSLNRLQLKVSESHRKAFVGDSVLQRLTFEQDKSPLLPSLKDITLDGCIASTDGLLSQMVESRVLLPLAPKEIPTFYEDTHSKDALLGVSKLERAEILWTSEINHMWDMARLGDLRRGGLDLNLHCLYEVL